MVASCLSAQGKRARGINLWFFFCPFLIGRNAVAIDGAASNRILLLPASVARVTLHGVNDTVFAFLHNAYMVGFSVAFPIKENNIACLRLVVSVFPLSVTLIIPKLGIQSIST